ncbi:MAG: hypothetical protein AB7O64_00315 [Methylibium sp.]
MNKLLIATTLALAAGSALAGGNGEPQDHGYAVYRQVVLGDTSINAASAPAWSRVGDTRVLGSYAQYLVYLGLSKNDAIAQAERAGEHATQADRSVAVERPQFSSHERYQSTVLGRSDSEILRDRQSSPRRLARADAVAN